MNNYSSNPATKLCKNCGSRMKQEEARYDDCNECAGVKNFSNKYYCGSYFIDSGKNLIKESLFNETADKIAQLFGRNASYSKIRQFYDAICWISSIAAAPVDAQIKKNRVHGELNIIICKARECTKRKNAAGGVLLPNDFLLFLRANSALVWECVENDFEIFKKHFEAVLSIGKGKEYFKK